MDKTNELFSLPDGPKGLCFNKNDFMKKSFSVDEFLQENRNVANLETMRDDLGVYLKVLRSSMIELINKDYADFVNLSANLVGLDVSINEIQTPLGQLKEEILLVKLTLTDVMSELRDCLEKRAFLRNQKRSLQNLIRIRNSITKLDSLLTQCDTINPALLERIASEFNQLEFSMTHCEHLENTHKDSRNRIHTRVCDEIDNFLRECIQSKNTDMLVRSLQIYSTLDKISQAENLFRKEFIAPAMDAIISESNLQARSDGLSGVYKQIIKFIDDNMLELLSITQGNNTQPIVKGFNFLLNSFWTEIEMRLETHMSSIFAPGNPDMFYDKYTKTISFLEHIESLFKDNKLIAQFRQHDQYKSFQQRWNLPVYFQIRFQEIGGSMETVCSGNFKIVNKNNMQLLQTVTTWECIEKCWSKGVFLQQIAHKFWKLTLQLLSRYKTWVMETLSSLDDDKIQKYVVLYTDLKYLVNKIPDIFNTAKKNFPNLSETNLHLLNASLDDSKSALLDCLPSIKDEIIKEISTLSIIHIRHVNDIPRLFRKTNRETPTKPCSYINSVLEAPMQFNDGYKQVLQTDIAEWMETIFSIITERLHSSMNELLASVQKTEESLRRLKQIRDRSNTTSTSEKSGITDDDKIRLQLLVDVTSYSESIKQNKIDITKIRMLQELIRLVEDATKDKIGMIK